MVTSNNRVLFKALSVLLVLAFLVSALPARQALAADCVENYTVKAGDTLYGIAFSYGVTMEAVAAANNMTAPYLLTIGQKVCIPSGGTGTTGTGTTSGTTTTTSTGPTLIVTRTEYGLAIQIAKFTSKNIYYVKAGAMGLRTHVWTRLGLIRIDKNGNATAYYALPKKLLDANVLHVCLKNARTNGVLCVRATY